MALLSETSMDLPEDEALFAWDATSGIVSVWAHRDGQALLWRREQNQVLCLQERYYPWLLATSLDDLAHLGPVLQPFQEPGGALVTAGQGTTLSPLAPALIRYRQLTGPTPSY